MVLSRDDAGAPEAPHRPVLLAPVTQLLTDAPDGTIVDATLGAGGHAAAVLSARAARFGHAHLVGIDRDGDALAIAEQRLAEAAATAAEDGAVVTYDLARTRFDAIDDVLDDLGVHRVAGTLLDLGISSMHVDRPERGFSYRQDGPLDMRMDTSAALTAAEIVNEYSHRELTRILSQLGEERFAVRVADAIIRNRPFTTTTQLAAVVRDAIPAATRRTGGHPATRTFQALRIEVNGELDALAGVLPRVITRLAPDGVFVVLAYHSLEDRLVKRAFADAARGCICPPDLPVCACGRVPIVDHLVRRPRRPDEDEIAHNPRAEAARLRAVRLIPVRS